MICSNVCSKIVVSLLDERVEMKGWSWMAGEAKEYGTAEMTNEEYREKIIEIFRKMDRTDKLRFWYKYISNIEKDED